MNTSAATAATLQKLRPPFARSADLVFHYVDTPQEKAGITVQLPVGEPAIAPGSGTVRRIYRAGILWSNTDPQLAVELPVSVVIDHGNFVTTLVSGMASTQLVVGQYVQRGDLLGSLQGTQLFCSILVGRESVNPVGVNWHWQVQNSNLVTGQGGKIRFAPDRLIRDLSAGVAAVLNRGLSYFNTQGSSLLVNVDFNGNGTKTGAAAVGSVGDYWQKYVPVDFTATVCSGCQTGGYNFYNFTAPVSLSLLDSNQAATGIFLERIAPLFSAAGSGVSWDPMLATWIGGYLGPVPYENTFRLRGMAAGNYKLYLYSEKGTYPTASTFYVSVDDGSPTVQIIHPNPVNTSFVPIGNYAVTSVTVPAGGYITLKAVGYLSGLQLQKV